MKNKVYNLSGAVAGEVELSDAVFGVKIKPELVHSVFVAMTNNQREPWADTKNRGEVSGGGKKPWQQKGTGRARHGSIRSPIWKGGGVAFGPLTERSYDTKINKKTRRLVMKMCLTDKAKTNNLVVLEDMNFADAKTKTFVNFLKVLPESHKSYIVLTAGKDDKVVRMTKNLKKVDILRAEDLNVMVMMNKEAIMISKDGLKKLEAILK